MKRKRPKRRTHKFKLQAMLRRQGMTLGELGRRTGLAKSTLTGLRQGRQLPTLKTLAVITEELECMVDDLLPTLGRRKGAAHA